MLYFQGSVALRVRRATNHDISFMEDFAKNKKNKTNQYYFSNLKGGAGALKSITTTYKKKGKMYVAPVKTLINLSPNCVHVDAARERRARQGQD